MGVSIIYFEKLKYLSMIHIADVLRQKVLVFILFQFTVRSTKGVIFVKFRCLI